MFDDELTVVGTVDMLVLGLPSAVDLVILDAAVVEEVVAELEVVDAAVVNVKKAVEAVVVEEGAVVEEVDRVASPCPHTGLISLSA